MVNSCFLKGFHDPCVTKNKYLIIHENSVAIKEISWFTALMEISRTYDLKRLSEKLKDAPVVAILGPRQCGKTTLARQFMAKYPKIATHFFDCEDPRDLGRLENAMLTLEPLAGIVIIDEIQRRPELFPVLRVLADQNVERQFIVLGSASRDLISQGAETLAGRIGFIELGGFSLHDIDQASSRKLWIRGTFPRSFLARSDAASHDWREDFIRTFLERDIPNLGIRVPPHILRRFWSMLAHYHGQVFKASEIGRSLNTSDTTVKRYLDILTGTFLIRQLQPWFYTTRKRLVKRPKIYFRDTGLLHTLMMVSSQRELEMHPRLGASWEGFALEQVLIHIGIKEDQAFFWATHSGAELDLVFQKKGCLWGLEIKYTDVPTITRSMRAALAELNLSHLWVVYPGRKTYRMDEKVTAVGFYDLPAGLKEIIEESPGA